MRFNILTTLYLATSLARASSWTETPEYAQMAEFMFATGGVNVSEATYIPKPKEDASSLHRRLTQGQVIQGKSAYNGWIVKVAASYVYTYAASKWTLPGASPTGPIDYLCTQFANAMAQVEGGSTQAEDIGGGWAMTAVGSNGYDPSDMPWQLAYDLMYQASTGANDWLTRDNGAYWTLKDTAGKLIYTFLVWPLNAVGTNPQTIHDEL